MTAINPSEYNFNVGLKKAYVIDDIETFPAEVLAKIKPIEILDKERLVVVREDNNKHLDIVSGYWEGLPHGDVVASIKQDVLPALGWNVVAEDLNLWMNGAIMFYSMQTEKEYTVGNTKLFATINAVNSHNRYTKAGVHITLQDAIGTNYLPTSAGKAVYTYESMLHRKGTLDLVRLQKLIHNIPVMIDNTVRNWSEWETQQIEYPRLYILSQLFSYRLGEEIVARMAQGGSRFMLYKVICEYMLNKAKMAESGFNSLTQMAKFIKIIKHDDYFTCELEALKMNIKKFQLFDWEEKAEKKEAKKIAKEQTTDTTVVVETPVEEVVADISSDEEVNEEAAVEETKQQVDSLLKDLL